MEDRTPVLNRGGWKDRFNLTKECWIFIFELVLSGLICIIHALSAGHYANFYPINGTFQNYNPVRRLLSGQIPYKDFQDYLGMGHLYIGTLFTALFGGDYQASLQAFSFLTFGGLFLLTLMVSLAIIKRKEIAGAATTLILVMILVEPAFFKNAITGNDEILAALEYALGTGNSARFIRGMILPISVFLIFLGARLAKKIPAKYTQKLRGFTVHIGIGLIAGFSFAWSNDYGISCWLCLLIISFFLAFSRRKSIKQAIVAFFVSAVASIISLLITVEVVTLGNFGKWLSSTFGTGGYQFWYYNSSKSYFLYDADFTYIMLIQAGLAVVYLYKLFKSNGTLSACRRYGILAFANMACFCAVNEYQYLSGGGSREVALTVLFLNILIELCCLVSNVACKTKIINAVLIASFVIGLAWTGSNIKDEIVFSTFTKKDGVEVKELGGNLTSHGAELLNTRDFLSGEKFFATYASAQEVVNDTFQPSGTDYIIHVLGDNQRNQYLESFTEGDFRYAATIRKEFTDWEYWVERSNWFFYRELYGNWHPVYANSYELYWEKNDPSESNDITDGITIRIEDIEESTKKIIIQCDKSRSGIADVYLDYSINKKNNRRSLITIQSALKVENTGTIYAGGGSYYESNFLRPKSAEYIPIPVNNGYGEVTITANPIESCNLSINTFSCNRILTAMDDYLHIESLQEGENTKILIAKNNAINQNKISNVSSLEYGGESYEILDISNDENNIYLTVNPEFHLDQKNQVKVVR